MLNSRFVVCNHCWSSTAGETTYIVSQTLHGHTAAVTKVLLHDNDEFLLAAASDGAIKLWDVQSGKGELNACAGPHLIQISVLLTGNRKQ